MTNAEAREQILAIFAVALLDEDANLKRGSAEPVMSYNHAKALADKIVGLLVKDPP